MELTAVHGFLLVIAAIFLVGIIGELLFERTGVPDVVWLIGVGLLLGPVTGLAERQRLLEFAPYFGAITLVVVLFNGGSQLRLSDLGRAAPRASVLALAGFVLSAVAVCLLSLLAAGMGLLPEAWTWMHGLMLGAILGGSSSVIIMPSLKKAPLSPELANLVNVESALTDVLCVVVAGALVQLLSAGDGASAGPFMQLARSFGLGLGAGAVAGGLSLLALQHLNQSAYAYPLVLAALLLLYVGIDVAGGSAALGILTAAVIVGNAPALSARTRLQQTVSLGDGVTGVHEQVAFIVKSFFFVLIGALLAPPWGLVGLGVALGVALALVRWPAVKLSLLRSGQRGAAEWLVTACLPRGMAAGVLSMLPAQAGVPGTEDLPVVVFAAAITSIALFAAGFAWAGKRLAAEAAPGTVEPVAAVPAPVPAPQGESLQKPAA